MIAPGGIAAATNNTVVWLRPFPVVAKVATRADSKLDAAWSTPSVPNWQLWGPTRRSVDVELAGSTPCFAGTDPHHAAVVRAQLLPARVALEDDTLMAALASQERTFIRSVFDAGLAELEGLDLDRQRLHGEPHQGNRSLTAQGVRWIDFESCCGASRMAPCLPFRRGHCRALLRR